MRGFDSWTAFLVMLFAVVGLCGLFASYSGTIPLERALMRGQMLDRVLDGGDQDRLRQDLGDLAPAVLDAPGPLDTRIAAARRVIADETGREVASIGYRTRLMLGVVTFIAAALGAGIMALARRQPPDPAS